MGAVAQGIGMSATEDVVAEGGTATELLVGNDDD